MNRRLFCSGLITAPAVLAKSGSPSASAKPAPKASRTLFASAAIHEFYVELDSRDWGRLRAGVASNDYYPAAVSWNGVSLPSVRLRARGRSSRNAAKPGLRIDLHGKGKPGALDNVEGLVLNNLANDPTALHDWLAMKLFRKAGVAAPRRSFARVFINRQEAGLFGLGEEIDHRFLHRHFRESKGFLCQYHAAGPRPERLGKKATRMRAMFEQGHLALPGGAHPDLGHLARVLAAESFCDDRQGLLSDKGADGLYFYAAKKPAAAYLIPWGKELSFGNWQAPLWPQTGTGVLASSVMAQPLGQELFRAAMGQLSALAGPGSWLEAKVQERAHMLRPLVAADRNRSLAGYDQAIAALLEFARRRPEVSGSYS